VYDWMEEGIVPGGTGSLLYNLIFLNHAFAGSAKVKKPLNMSKSGEPTRELDVGKSSTASSAKTVSQIRDESKAKQLARLEAASLCPKKRKSGEPDEPSSGGVGVTEGDQATKKPVPFATYRACTESTRKELKLKKHPNQCHLEADAIKGKWEAPSEFLVAIQKTPHQKGDSRYGVGSTGQVWGCRQKAETPQGSQGDTHMSKPAFKTETRIAHELPRSLWPPSKTEEELVYRLNVDSPMRARGEDSQPGQFAGGFDDSGIILWPGCLFDSHCHLNLVLRRLEEAEELPRESLVLLEETIARDGQHVDGNTLGGVVTNLHLPRDWSIYEQLHPPLPSGAEQPRRQQGCRVHYAIGCHPKQAALLTTPLLKRLVEIVRRPGVVAVGECGLDYSARSFADREVQATAFQAQIQLALRYNLPLVLHVRDQGRTWDGGLAEEDCYRILEECKVPRDFPMHRHCFNGNWKSAQRWLSMYPASKIGLTALVTFPKALHIHEVARRVPLSRLLLETDAPYFAPCASPASLPKLVMMESPVNKVDFAQPGHVLQVAAAVAYLKGVPLKQVLLANLRNISEIYGVPTSGQD